jgi:DNA modification methylase
VGFVQKPCARRQDLRSIEEIEAVQPNENAQALNALCPYFTMFPLSFPKGILARHSEPSDRVLDPFCGRGTTNFAARTLGLETLGLDSSPVATAITAAKLVSATPSRIERAALEILNSDDQPAQPEGEFWRLAFHPKVLSQLCKLRDALIFDCRSEARIALRGIVLGALHGPRNKETLSYFSNQCFRTYAPKPRYAVKFWKTKGMRPPRTNVLEVIRRRANRFYSTGSPVRWGRVVLGDSREPAVVRRAATRRKFNWIITSPPYYGMRTYVQDQWLRNWFLGGTDFVDYQNVDQLEHQNQKAFASQLNQVWKNCAAVSEGTARLVIRFGAIGDRELDPRELVRESLRDSGWKITTIKSAGTAQDGKRQANAFLNNASSALSECDVWATRAS